jgi:mono/diheme cytochrome c family protein
VLLAILLPAVVAMAAGPAAGAPPGATLWEDVSARQAAPAPDTGLLARGRLLYGVRCSSCHGATGRGDGPASLYLTTLPRDFSRLAYKLRTHGNAPSDLDLFRSITAGFPAYGMPSFGYLPERDRWALVHTVRELGRDGWIDRYRQEAEDDFDPGKAREIVAAKTEPGPPVVVGEGPRLLAGGLSRGKAIYEKSCQACHGPDGRGDGPSADTLKDDWDRPIRARDFTASPIYRKGGWRPRDLVRLTRTGIAGVPMPAFEDLTDQQRWELAAHVEELVRRAR